MPEGSHEYQVRLVSNQELLRDLAYLDMLLEDYMDRQVAAYNDGTLKGLRVDYALELLGNNSEWLALPYNCRVNEFDCSDTQWSTRYDLYWDVYHWAEIKYPGMSESEWVWTAEDIATAVNNWQFLHNSFSVTVEILAIDGIPIK